VETHSAFPPVRRTKAQLQTFLNSDLAHTILINDALIGFDLLCQQDSSFRIAASTHERDFKTRPFQLPNDQSLVPDAWIELHRRVGTKTGRFRFVLEVQGESNWTTTTIREKVRKYITLEEQGIHTSSFSLPDEAVFWVLFLTTGGTAKVAIIKTAIERELTAQKKQDAFATMFLVAPLSTEGIVYNDPVWQQPFAEGEKTLWEWL
jgi:hypothetical protein